MKSKKDPFYEAMHNVDAFSTKNYVILYACPLGAKNSRVVIALDYTPPYSGVVRLVITLDDKHYELGGVDAWDPEFKSLEIYDVISASVREIDHPDYSTLAYVQRGSIVKHNFKSDLFWLNSRLKFDFGKSASIINTTKEIERNLLSKEPSQVLFEDETQSEFQIFFFANSPIVRNMNRENRYELQYKVGDKRKRVEVLNPQPIVTSSLDNDAFCGYALLQCVHGSNTYRIIGLYGHLVKKAINQSLIDYRLQNADAATSNDGNDPTDDDLNISIDEVIQEEEDDEDVYTEDDYDDEDDYDVYAEDEEDGDEYDEYDETENQYMEDIFDDKKINRYYERIYEQEEEEYRRNLILETEYSAKIINEQREKQREKQRIQKLYGIDSIFICCPKNPEYASAENCKTVVRAYKSGKQGIYANNAYGAEFWEEASADQLPKNDSPEPF